MARGAGRVAPDQSACHCHRNGRELPGGGRLWESLEVSSIFSIKQEARASARSEEERRCWRLE